jgi:hypothetical protein
MMRRLFWFGLAAATGIVVYRKLSRTARSYTPSGLAGSAQQTAVGLLDSVREFMADVRDGMAEREAEIHAALAENAGFGSGLAGDSGPAGGADALSLADLLGLGDGADDVPDNGPDRSGPQRQEGETDR